MPTVSSTTKTNSKTAMDPAYMKPSAYSASMETHDLGRRLSQAELHQLASRNWNRSFEQGILAGVSSVEPRLQPLSSTSSPSTFSASEPQRRRRRRNSSTAAAAAEFQPPALMSTSNADVARREAVLQGEFDIISRSHVVRYEQDSAFKKDRRVTPEIMALHNAQPARPTPPRGRSVSGRQLTSSRTNPVANYTFREPNGFSTLAGAGNETKRT